MVGIKRAGTRLLSKILTILNFNGASTLSEIRENVGGYTLNQYKDGLLWLFNHKLIVKTKDRSSNVWSYEVKKL